MEKSKVFETQKKRALQKLRNAECNNEVDEKIVSILHLINNSENFYTSSSCSGRIVLLQLPRIGDKKNAKFLGKWHGKVNINDFLKAFKKAGKGQIWLLAQSPIFHVVAKNLDYADKILKTAVLCGFKNSGLKSIKGKKVVEICSTERLDAPISDDKDVLPSLDYLKFLVGISNEIIEKSDEKLKRLEETLKNQIVNWS